MDKVPKKRAPAKAKVIKVAQTKNEVVLPVKKVVTKKLIEKPVTTKADTKVKPKTKVTKVTKKLLVKKVASKANKNSEEVKLVPGSISLRLAEKRKLYERVYQDYVPKVMRPLAITGGYAYITMGIFLAVLMSNPGLSNLVSQTASALCFAGECQTATTTDATTTEPIKPVEFKPLAPIVPGADTNLQLVQNLNIPVRLLLLPISGGESMIITGVSESASNIVNFLLPTASLSNGRYVVQAELYVEETKQVKFKLVGPTIIVENAVAEVVPPQEVQVTSEEVIDDELTDEGEVLGVSTSTIETEDDTESLTKEALEEELVSASVVKEVEVLKVVPVKKSELFDLTVIPGTTSNQSILKILPTFVFDKVELALRLKGEGETFFLGQATKADESWFYWLDNKTIPNGSYTLIVRGFDNEEFKGEATFSFTNHVKTVLSGDVELAEIENRVDTLLNDGLDISELKAERASYVTTYLETSEVNYPDDYLTDYLPKLDRLFAKYASAVAGANNALVIIADEEIEKYIDSVLVEEDASQEFTHEITALLLNTKEYIKTREAEVIKLSGGDSAFDTDKDGLTDYDEVVIFETDPKLPDTDNDGILDSVEILSGYDATDAKLEAVSRFTGTIQNGVINGELLALSAVSPLYLYAEANTEPKILTSVSGKGIPNSFARIYIPDLPESIIVKVGEDGTFTQTIDIEFTKVAGEVALAITDNTGRIVFRGQPLLLARVLSSNVLFGQAGIDASVINSINEFKNSNTIGAIGVVSFGLILLLLGKTLVPRREPVSLEIA